MGLKCFTKFVQKRRLSKPYKLGNCELMVDGSGITGRLYKRCTEDSTHTRDYDHIAATTRKFFKDLVDCNVQCFVVFDGGHDNLNMKKKIERLKVKIKKAQNHTKGRESVPPILLENVVMEVMDDMNIPYIICETEEADRVIAALAKYFRIPILSSDSDFYMTEAKYINYENGFHKENNFIHCKIYDRAELLKQFKLKKEVLPILSLILGNNYYLPKTFFDKFLSANGINTRVEFLRITGLLLWLKNKTFNMALSAGLRGVMDKEENTCRDIIRSAEFIISPDEPNEFYSFCFMTEYDADSKNVEISQNDPDWFEKGILTRRIAKPYIDLYNSKKFLVSAQPENFNEEDSFVPCFRILRYAFDLLRSFSNESIEYEGRCGRRAITTEFSISKPDRSDYPFGSGWDSLPDYFGHFVRQTMPGLPEAALNDLPEYCRLWLIALVWWRRCARNNISETHCLLLCRASDGVDLTYLKASPREAQVPHGFAQFQNILQQIDYLSRLCGSSYVPVRYRDAYCDSVARGAFAAMKTAGVEPGVYVEGLLQNSDNAYRLYGKLVSVYNRCVEAVINE